jgi:hypothetical protein
VAPEVAPNLMLEFGSGRDLLISMVVPEGELATRSKI